MQGQTLGSYTIERELGRGGMGAVYVAVHTLLGRRAAVKVLLPELSKDHAIVERFFNEARAATAIKHPSIVEIYDFGWAPDGSAYIVMEYMTGESLAARLARLGRLPAPAAVTIARQIANALAAAHRAGIVHRDLKPDNAFLVEDVEVVGGERVKLLDFGIAKLVTGGGVSRTSTGAIMGTPLYMSPEQCEGARAVDHRTDLYALGCILFEMFAGRPPFQSEGVGGLIGMHLHVPPPALRAVAPDAPADVEAIVARLLAKAPGDRFQTADELVAALAQVGTAASAAASPSSPSWPGAAAPVAAPPVTAPPVTAGAQAVAPAPSTLSGSSRALASPPPAEVAPRGRGRGRALAIGAGVVVVGAAIAIAAVAGGGGGDRGGGTGPVAGDDVDAAAAAAIDAASTVVLAPPSDAAVVAEDATVVAIVDGPVVDPPVDGGTEDRARAIAARAAEIEVLVKKRACAEARRVAAQAIATWGAEAAELEKLARKCKPVTVDAGVPPPWDELTREEVNGVVARQRARLGACASYEPVRVAAILTIAPDGGVTAVRFSGTEGPVRACLERVLRALRFPTSTRGGTFPVPLAFKGTPTTGPVEEPPTPTY